MAHIQRRRRGGRTRWIARTLTPDGRERTRTFDRRIDAERWITSVEASKLAGTYVDPARGRQRFEEFAREWKSAQVHRPTTEVQLETHLVRHILPTFGSRPIAGIRPSEIQAWVKDRSEKLAPSTLEVIYRWLAAIFRAAVEDGVITRSPCRGIRLPKVERPKVVPPTTDDVLAITEAMPDRYRALVTLAAGTGLRQGEAFGVTVPRIDFERRRLHVDQQLVKIQGRAAYLGPPKTPASRRTVPLPDVVNNALTHHLREFEPGTHDLVFTDRHGGPINRTRFSDAWRRALKTAGVTGVTFHGLRHYYASLLIRHGESVKVVQARLGHASASETLDTYSHLWPDSEEQTRDAVDRVLRGVRGMA